MLLDVGCLLMFYRYVAIDPAGARREGKMEAASISVARSQLKASGLEPVLIKEDYLSAVFAYLPFSRTQLKNREVLEFISFLADFLGSGMDMAIALENLERVVESKKTQAAARAIRTHVMKGSSLSEAMKRTGLFSDLIHAGIYAGEQAGELVRALRNLEEGVRQAIDFTSARPSCIRRSSSRWCSS
ncbi:MAG: type II secretion system F family protein [Deltaproteobacteria bacterium]|nr:type II secretion system F family protein [Deltaproteobacteria bacterium]